MNKLVKGNLVRGLPSKLFENDQTCVACQKGKQHRASCKSKTVSSISQPLHMLHMDLFGPTFVKSLMKKMYCLVVTNDYNRFSWVFFLSTKDETSGILKSVITGVENLIDQRVKVIRCDNGTEFKKKEMNQFCKRKGIKREFSVARTPQQNGVAKRKNRTLIEAARTMLADFKKARNADRYRQRFIFDALWPLITTLSKSKSSPVIVQTFRSIEKKGLLKKLEKKVVMIQMETTLNIINVVSSTVNAAGIEVNVVGAKISIELLDDPNMPELEEIVYSDNDEIVGAEADMNNLNTFMPISPILTTRIHKDHPVEQIIRDLNSAPQTRRMTKNLEEHGLFSSVQQRTNHKDFQNCLFACFLSQEEPKKVIHALKDPSWIEAMQDELLQFKLQKKVVAQGYTQEEGIDYDEVFAPVARIEAIRLFLTYASFKDFMVYQMDVKSAFLYGKIEKEVYVCQLPGFEDPDFPDRRGKIDKTLFIRRDKGDILLVQVYVDDIIFGSTKKSLCTEFEKMMHKKLQMSSMGELTFFLGLQTTSTPIETQKPLLKDEDVEEVDVHLYRSSLSIDWFIDSILLLQGLILCYAVCLWYPKDSPFDLVAYTDSDYAGASLDRKSTTRVCQFLRCRLISWQCKKQTVVANSTTKAEYVAALS
ncbi:putative ribonuclease H-like domain-containing protein [Tanacetum coccineum]